jgi:DNA-binding transcriptional regulator PaaX
MKKNKTNRSELYKKVRLKASEVLCTLFDNVVDTGQALMEHKPYKVSAEAYFKSHNREKSDIRQQLYYLEKNRLIKTVLTNNEHYFEITKKGKEKLIWERIGKARRESRWDKNFRLVMFDVPENKKTRRDAIRRKLEEIGFIQMQKSVFVYPFDCKRDIEAICFYLSASKYLKYLVVKITEGEKEIINKFLEKNVLSLDDLK